MRELKNQLVNEWPRNANNFECRICGSTLTTEQGKRSALCAYCGNHQELDENIIDVVHYHEALIDGQLSKAQAFIDFSDMFEKDPKRMSVSRFRLLDFLNNSLFIVAPSLLIMLLLAIVADTGAVQIEMARMLFRIFSATLCVLLLLLYVYYGYRPEKYASASSSDRFDASVILGCASCGAENRFKLRRVSTQCRCCGATLYLTIDEIQKGMEAARLLRRQSKQRFIRNDRAMVVQNKALFWFIAFFFLFMYGQYHFSLDTGLGTKFTVVTIGIGIVILSILYGVLFRFLSIQKTWAKNISPLCIRYNGTAILNSDIVTDWIDEWWPTLGVIDVEMTGMRTNAVSCKLDMFRVLLWFDMRILSKKSKICFFLSAVVPGLESGGYGNPMHTEETGRLRMELERHGFEVYVKEEGIKLSATPVLVSEIRKNPDLITRYIPPILDKLLQLAGAYQCRP